MHSGLDAKIDSVHFAMRSEVGSLRSEMNARFDSVQRTMIQFGGGMIAALVGLAATQL